jgi:hypothetical protein
MPKYVQVGARLYFYDDAVSVTGIRGPFVLIQSAPHSGLPSQVHYTYLRRAPSAEPRTSQE